MSNPDSLHGRYRSHVADLAGALDAGDETAFRAAFERLRAELNLELNPELKRITASAQTVLRRFREHARLDALAAHEVPDARKRLAHVVQLTGEAAHRTLDLVGQSVPLVDRWTREAARLLQEWKALAPGECAADSWPHRAQVFMAQVLEDAQRLRGLLSQMLQAQGYQDLTGQIIRGVNEFVGDLEQVFGQLVALANGEDTRRMPALRIPADSGAWRRGTGPRVPGVDDANALNGQEDIDALLDSVAGGPR